MTLLVLDSDMPPTFSTSMQVETVPKYIDEEIDYELASLGLAYKEIVMLFNLDTNQSLCSQSSPSP